MGEQENVVIEPATEADLDELSEMLGELFSQESDFRPDKDKQLRGLRLIFEQPSRGRVFVLRRNGAIVGMINLLFTISTAEGGFVILLEDLVVHTQYQGQGYGNRLLEHAIDFAKQKNFLRITLLTDRPENVAQSFFRKHGFIDSSMIPMRLWIAPQQNSDQQRNSTRYRQPSWLRSRLSQVTSVSPKLFLKHATRVPLQFLRPNPSAKFICEPFFEFGAEPNFIDGFCHIGRTRSGQVCLRISF
jgi:GNAT superfamily N-acetyltransferase